MPRRKRPTRTAKTNALKKIYQKHHLIADTPLKSKETSKKKVIKRNTVKINAMKILL